MKKIVLILLVLVGFVMPAFSWGLVPGEEAPPSSGGTENGGNENPSGPEEPGNENPPGGNEEEEGPHGPNIDSIKSDINNNLDGIEKDNEGIPDPEKKDSLSSVEKSETSKIEGKITASKDAAKSTATGNQKKTEANAKKSGAEKKGDPVNICTGEFVQEDTDFSLKNEFKISRIYRSENKITGSFGSGISSVFDERLLFGVMPGCLEIYNENAELYDYLVSEKKSFEEKFITQYKVSSMKEGISEIEARISASENILEKLKVIENSLDNLRNYYGFPEERDRLQSIRNAVTSNIEAFNEIKSAMNYDLTAFDSLDEKINAAKKNRDEAYSLYLESRKAENAKTIFKGTPEEWYKTSFETIVYVDSENIPHSFEKKEKQWIPVSDSEKTFKNLSQENDGTYVLKKKNGSFLSFSPEGFLVKITDRNGNKTELERNESGKVISVKNDFNQLYKVSYNGNFISEIKNDKSPDEKFSYSYKENLLSSVTDSEMDRVEYEYDDSACLTKILKPDGSFISYVYGQEDSSGNRIVTSTVNEESFAEYFSYDLQGQKTVYTDHDGNKWVVKYDEDFRKKEETAPSGEITTFEYDAHGNLAKETTGGYEICYSRDSEGNLERESFSDGSSRSYLYDGMGNISSYTDRDGIKVSFIYDEKGNLLGAEKNGNVLCSIEVNEKGLPVKLIEKCDEDIVFEYEYDERGNVVALRKGSLVTKYEYDSRERPVKIYLNDKLKVTINYFGNKTLTEYESGLKTEYVYNNRKDLVRITEEDTVLNKKRIFEYEYDARHLPLREYVVEGDERILKKEKRYSPEGKIISEILYEKDGSDAWIMDKSYRNGEVSEITYSKKSDPEKKQVINFERRNDYRGSRTVTVKYPGFADENYEYDFTGNLKKLTDSEYLVYEFFYTKEGLPLKVPSDFGGYFEYEYDNEGFVKTYGEEGNETDGYEYYVNGKIRKFRNSKGETVSCSYDANGNMKAVSSSIGTSFYGYDAEGNVNSLVMGFSDRESDAILTRKIRWENKGRTAIVSYGDAVEEKITYDGFGNIVSKTDGVGNEKNYEYDFYGRMVLYKDSYGNEISFSYNPLDQVTRTDYPDGSFVKFEYDAMGNLLCKRDGKGVLWEGQYDSKGNLVEEKARGSSRRKYTYDGSGRITGIEENGKIIEENRYFDFGKKIASKDASGNVSYIEKDSFGRVVKETNRLGKTQTCLYDSDGSLLKKTDFSGNTSSYRKTDFGTLSVDTFSDGTGKVFEYDMAGNLISAKNEFSSYVYEYNKAGLLVREKDEVSGETVSYSYDKAGRRIKMKGSGRDLSYEYGKNGELIEVKDINTGIKCSFEYDKLGREVRRKFGNGITQTYSYDVFGQMVSVVQKDSAGKLVFAEGYVYDKDDHRYGTVNHLGQVTLYEYNADGKLSKVLYPYTEEIREHLKTEIENLGGLTDDGYVFAENIVLTYSQYSDFSKVMETFYAGASGMLTNHQIVCSEEYAFDANGNRIVKENPIGKISYEYDEENNLRKICVNEKCVVECQQDANGNILCIDSVKSGTSYFSYNSDNRMVSCEKQDPSENLSSQAFYYYDSLSRRILTSEKKGDQLISSRTVYDGFTFDVIKECPVYDNGQFANVYAETRVIISDGESQTERYRFLSENINRQKNVRTASRDESVTEYLIPYEECFPLFTMGKPLAENRSEKNAYFATDILSTVKNTTDDSGIVSSSFSYDAYGSLIGEKVPAYGYNGKSLDRNTGFYDYGFRHYSPDLGRFSTKDPVRDGTNWFAYVNGDPVNYVDLWGLKIAKQYGIYVMNDDRWNNKFLGNTKITTLGLQGCAVVIMSNIVSSFEKHQITPVYINSQKELFEGNNLRMDVVAERSGLVMESWEKSKVNIQSKLKEVKNSANNSYIAAQVAYDKEGHLHWVGVNDVVTRENGKTYVEIVPTSLNDKKASRKLDSWVEGKNGKMYVEVSAINKFYTFSAKKNN